MSNTLRPAREWLNDLPPGYRERAIANCEKFPINPGEMVGSLLMAISYAFHWGKTPEKPAFWEAVYQHYDAIPLPPLPTE